MTIGGGGVSDRLVYTTGLDPIQEAVVSSHFMEKLAKNRDIDVYPAADFAAKCLEIDAHAVYERLIPDILDAAEAFCLGRADGARARARDNHRKYGLDDPRQVGTAEFVTEVMFDQQYLRGPRERCSREQLCEQVRERLRRDAPIELVIPALPLKFFSPLKTRGRRPDLAELNFVVGLYEIVKTIDIVYRAGRPDLTGVLARFTVVSDGSRFNEIINEPDAVVENYRIHLERLIQRLELGEHIELLDYRTLLRDRLPAEVRAAKAAIVERARGDYGDVLWPVFEPCDMAAALRTAGLVEPDPESSSLEGRFVALLKSLVYTINYRVLDRLERLSGDDYRALYRDLTAHIFEPYTTLVGAEPVALEETAMATADASPSDEVKEHLRQAMLAEVWAATIDYLAEIKSDRELSEDPILICLPHHIRWTIHAKAGQMALLTPSASGLFVQPWAGTAVFRATKKNRMKLCALPVLALEGEGAIPVRMSADDVLASVDQPCFYLHPDLGIADIEAFLVSVKGSLDRRKVS